MRQTPSNMEKDHPPSRPAFREEPWDNYEPTHSTDPMAGAPAPGYDYRYRDDQAWASHAYYDPSVSSRRGDHDEILTDDSLESIRARV